MGLSIKGYVLEPPRVGRSNSPFTLTPNNLISDQTAFDTAFPLDESTPRVEYMCLVLDESYTGPTGPVGQAVLPDALFGWTKNEGEIVSGTLVPFQRFGYYGVGQLFKPLPGQLRESLGTLEADANTTRLTVTAIPTLDNSTDFPFRMSTGTGSGTTFAVDLVTSFTTPTTGRVQLDTTTGELHWLASDITSNLGDPVYFQPQSFSDFGASDSSLGDVADTGSYLLSPIPAANQYPLIRLGFGPHLTPIYRATEGAFTTPSAGNFEWAGDTGLLNFNSADLTANPGVPVYYDGVLISTFQVPLVAEGEIQNTLTILPVPDEASDVHFQINGTVRFAQTNFVDAFSQVKRGEVQIRRSDGELSFSESDQATYTGQTVQSVVPDILLEKGVSLRLFRSVVNPSASDATVKDITAIYTKDGSDPSTLADPIVGQPSVFLPAIPRSDLPIVVSVEQGTGTYVGPLARLDVSSPPVGRGYILDYEGGRLLYAERKETEILAAPATNFGAIQLPDFPVYDTNLSVELEDNAGMGDFQPLVQGQDFLMDLDSGLVQYTQTEGTLVISSSNATSITGTTLTSIVLDFVAEGVSIGDSLIIEEGANEGVFYISSVSTSTLSVDPSTPFTGSDVDVAYSVYSGKEVLADRFFQEVPPVDPNTQVERLVLLGVTLNSPRLQVDATLAESSRFRFGSSVFSSVVNIVSSFTTPASMLQGTVEINENSGELNFSQDDVDAGLNVYWSRELQIGEDYSIQAGLGFIEFTQRLLEEEEVHITYAYLNDDGSKTVIEERGAFLVPKELTATHPTPASTLSFNPLSREVAESPAPLAYRGGRPQITGSQVSFNTTTSTVTFLSDNQVTDALPHGPVVSPDENVYVDYYIHGAVGGENNLTVSQTPMASVVVSIVGGTVDDPVTSFTIEGDRTAEFEAGRLLRLDRTEVYLLAAPSFDGTVTTVNLDQTAPQTFRSDLRNPLLEVSSGKTRRATEGVYPSYFTQETAAYTGVPRGSTELRLEGNLTRVYRPGTAIFFTLPSVQDFNLIEGAVYNEDLNKTVLTLSSGVIQQFSTSLILYRSVRPILATPDSAAFSTKAPLLDLPYLAYKQVEGAAGRVLTRDVDYTIDESGQVRTTPLSVNEELSLIYTGNITIDAGRRTRASWTFAVVPSISNGLVNQILKMEYSTYIPDTFFYRVENLTNYQAELTRKVSANAVAKSPTQGPILSNAASPRLYEEGAKSIWFEEGDLTNQDSVAVPTLKYVNDMVNSLEGTLGNLDGRSVGDHDGLFLFDGNLDNPVRATFAEATNQIDDAILTFEGSVLAYTPSPTSRFYPTRRTQYGLTTTPTPTVSGDPVMGLGSTNLQTVSTVSNRTPWAVVTEDAPAGSTVIQVDAAEGASELLRPGLDVVANLEVAITQQDGTVVVGDGAPAVVSSTTPTSVTFTAPVNKKTPKGSTIRMSTEDTTYRTVYTMGVDIGTDLNAATLTHINAEDAPGGSNNPPPANSETDAVVQVGVSSITPDRFPALDGGTTDDDGDRQFPILTPYAASEGPSLEAELALINDSTGAIPAVTTKMLVDTGTLDGTATVIDRGSAWVTPPVVGHILRVTEGANAASYYHYITAVGAQDVTLYPAFKNGNVAVTFEYEEGVVLEPETTGTLSSATVLDDPSAQFITNGVLPGHTVIGAGGGVSGKRRSVVSVNSETQLTVTEFEWTGAITYEITNPIASFSGPGSLHEDWTAALYNQLTSLEGPNIIDLEDIPVTSSSTQSASITGIDMGDYQGIVVFVQIENNGSGHDSCTFDGVPLTLQKSHTSMDQLGVHLYTGTATGVGDLVSTASSGTVASHIVFMYKVRNIENIVVSAGTNTQGMGTASNQITPKRTGDLVITMTGSSLGADWSFPTSGQTNITPKIGGSGSALFPTASRAIAGGVPQNENVRYLLSPPYGVVFSVGITMTPSPDSSIGRLIAFFLTALGDSALTTTADLTGSTVTPVSLVGVVPGDAVFVRDGVNMGIYTVDTIGASTFTIVETFPGATSGDVIVVGSSNLVSVGTLQDVMVVLKNAEAAFRDTGRQYLANRSYVGTSNGVGYIDPWASFPADRVDIVNEGYCRPTTSLSAREAEVVARQTQVAADVETLEAVLDTSDRLYDVRYVWIDGRINRETGILERKQRAVSSRESNLEELIRSLTKLLTM